MVGQRCGGARRDQPRRGATWADAELDPPTQLGAWQGWRFLLDAGPGELELCSRATDATGEAQPDRPRWNLGGYRNHAIQRVAVTVTGP